MTALRFVARLEPRPPTVGALSLPWEKRCRSRFRAQLDSGLPCGCLLPRGTVLRDGDCLLAESGEIAVVRAAPEELSVASSEDTFLLLRAAYHLGNRHVPLELSPGRLSYQHDHVLDELARELGLEVRSAVAPFHPEAGAYSSGGHHHEPPESPSP